MSEATLSPARMLLAAVRGYLDEHYPGWTVWPGMLPEGLRLEMHPYAYYMVMQDRYTRDWPSGDWREWRPVFGLPVKVTPDMPDGTWRLVVVAVLVLLAAGAACFAWGYLEERRKGPGSGG